MRVVCISDTHERHEQIALPDGDLLICAGDMTANGNLASLERFAQWMQRQPHPHKILIAGNHDFCFEEKPDRAQHVMRVCAPDVHYLQDSGLLVGGVRVWGSPWQPRFFDWAFNLDRGARLAEKWALIPDDTAILVTHGPPFGTLDVTPRGQHAGCEALAARLNELSVRLHVFGHIHYSHGVVEHEHRISINASICDERYAAVQAPVVVELN